MALAQPQLLQYRRSEQLTSGIYIEYIGNTVVMFKVGNQTFKYKPRKNTCENYKKDVMAVPQGEIHLLSIDTPLGRLMVEKRMVTILHRSGIVLRLVKGKLQTSAISAGMQYDHRASDDLWLSSPDYFLRIKEIQNDFAKMWLI